MTATTEYRCRELLRAMMDRPVGDYLPASYIFGIWLEYAKADGELDAPEVSDWHELHDVAKQFCKENELE